MSQIIIKEENPAKTLFQQAIEDGVSVNRGKLLWINFDEASQRELEGTLDSQGYYSLFASAEELSGRTHLPEFDLVLIHCPSTPEETVECIKSIATLFSESYIMFILSSPSRKSIRASYLYGNSAVSLPIEEKRLLSIIAWSVSSSRMERSKKMEAGPEHHPPKTASLRKLGKDLKKNLLIILVVLVLSAAIGFGIQFFQIYRLKSAQNENASAIQEMLKQMNWGGKK